MSMRISTISLCLAGLVCLFGSQAALAKKMYRWVDEHGDVFFSDQVPPEHAGYRRESLNEKGRVVDVTPQARTKEQQAQDRQLEALRKAQEKMIAKQKSHDQVLLSTFRSLDDMQAMLENNMKTLEIQKSLLQSNLKSLESQLEAQQKLAAAHERNGEKSPAALLDRIKSAESQIQLAQAEIDKQSEKMQQAQAQNAADVERYKFLIGSGDGTPAANAETAQNKMPELGLFICDSEAQCAKAWTSAHHFINTHASTDADIDNDKLIMSKAPAKDGDLSLSVSRTDDGNGRQQLFLDVHCRDTSLGVELCASQKVWDIRSAFRPYIESALLVTDQ
jgi:hypothetical protein